MEGADDGHDGKDGHGEITDEEGEGADGLDVGVVDDHVEDASAEEDDGEGVGPPRGDAQKDGEEGDEEEGEQVFEGVGVGAFKAKASVVVALSEGDARGGAFGENVFADSGKEVLDENKQTHRGQGQERKVVDFETHDVWLRTVWVEGCVGVGERESGRRGRKIVTEQEEDFL